MSIKKIKKINLPIINEKNGSLFFIESKKSKFKIKRVFFVNAKKNSIRGRHAHKKISQIMICLSGKVEIMCDDGLKKKKFVLNKKNQCLIVPKLIWSVLKYKSKNTILSVLCSGFYSENEYIRNYDTFKKITKKKNV